MTFITYAQNFEDVILRRVLAEVEKGFYVDVGANDPERDSVTRAFYDAGWHGINIEPDAQWFERLSAARTRDVNLPVFVSDRAGTTDFFVVADTGLSTFDPAIAARHRADGWVVRQVSAETRTLASILAEYGEPEIHFLKIDVEGAELSVLRGSDFERFRPWVLVVEATEPQRRTTNYEAWESIVLAAGYRFVLFDGLNRFYLAEEHAELADRFALPPNVFDDFRRHDLVHLEEHHRATTRNLEEVIQATERDRDAHVAHVAHVTRVVANLEQQVFEKSRSIEALEDEVARLGAAVREYQTDLANARATAATLLAAARALERKLWTRAYVSTSNVSLASRATNRALGALRLRIRRVRKVLGQDPKRADALASLVDLLDVVSQAMPDEPPRLAMLVPVDELLARPPAPDSAGEVPDEAIASVGLRAQVAMRRRLRRARKFLIDRPELRGPTRPLQAALQATSAMLPSEPSIAAQDDLQAIASALDAIASLLGAPQAVAATQTGASGDDALVSAGARSVYDDLGRHILGRSAAI